MGCGSSTTPSGLSEEEVTVGHQGSVQARTCEIEQTKSQPAGASQRSYSLMLSHALSLMLSRPLSSFLALPASHSLSSSLPASRSLILCSQVRSTQQEAVQSPFTEQCPQSWHN